MTATIAMPQNRRTRTVAGALTGAMTVALLAFAPPASAIDYVVRTPVKSDCPCKSGGKSAWSGGSASSGHGVSSGNSVWNGEPIPLESHYSSSTMSPRPAYSSPRLATTHSASTIVDSYEWTSTRYVPRATNQNSSRSHEAILSRLGGAQTIWAGTKPDRLIGVELHGDQASDANLSLLARIPELRIVVLAPSSPRLITDTGIARLAPLKNLEYLGLGGTGVTDQGLAHLQHFPQLRRLELPPNSTDAGIVHLLQCPELEQLRVWPAKITNEGVATLSQIACLRFLDLNGTHIDDAALPHLRQLTSLEVLDLRRTQVTAAGLSLLVPSHDDDCMHFAGPSRLRKLYVPNRTVMSGESLVSLIRLLGICEIETSRPQPEPGKPPRPAETIVPELTATWQERAMLEGFREEIAHWKALGAYVEFAEMLVDPDFIGSIPPALLEGRPSPDNLQRLIALYREQAYRHITGIYFVRPRTKDDRPRDDRIFPVTLGNSRLPPMLERLSLRDTEVSASTVASVVVPSIRAGVPLKVLNVFNTTARGTEAVTKEGFPAILGSPGSDLRPHLPFNPGQPGTMIPPIADRPTLTPEELKAFAAALQQLERIVVTEEQAEAVRRVLPEIGDKLVARPRYLPNESAACCLADDGTLKPMFCVPGR